jgi:hypothetical protein
MTRPASSHIGWRVWSPARAAVGALHQRQTRRRVHAHHLVKWLVQKEAGIAISTHFNQVEVMQQSRSVVLSNCRTFRRGGLLSREGSVMCRCRAREEWFASFDFFVRVFMVHTGISRPIGCGAPTQRARVGLRSQTATISKGMHKSLSWIQALPDPRRRRLPECKTWLMF